MKVSVSSVAFAAVLALGLVSPGLAHQEAAGNLKIGHPWIRMAEAGAPSTYACIIEIKNDGDEPETLLGATVDGAGTGVLYQIIETDGHFSSKVVDHGLVIKPHGSIEAEPDHLSIPIQEYHQGLDRGLNGRWHACVREIA